MAVVTVIRQIEAPVDVVFGAVADARRFSEVLDGVTHFEFLGDVTSGVGTLYRQTRVMGGREQTMDFEITECVEGERVRILNETHGTVWDTVLTMAPKGDGACTLTMRMDALADGLFKRMMLTLVCKLIQKAVAKDMDALKAFCEAGR